jgi:UDPglucose--hexose-1-phosphate uridylyltransferase
VYGVAILNHLRAAGASIAHPHAQVFALDLVPHAVEAALARFRTAGIDLVLADVLDDHVVQTHGEVVTWCPPASSSKYLFRLAAEAAGNRFDRADDDTTEAVALALRDALGDVPYNVVVHTAPRSPVERAEQFHWYVEVTPRLSVVAGFEQATGILVNTVPPDQAAEVLRDATPR